VPPHPLSFRSAHPLTRSPAHPRRLVPFPLPAGGINATLDYAQLHRESVALAHWLHQQGIGRGDAVAVHCRNSAAVMRIHFAAAALHAVVVNLNINLATPLPQLLTDQPHSDPPRFSRP